ncbi:MAG: DUF4926 domain-containing protein [Candidatus Binataceae bacterium]
MIQEHDSVVLLADLPNAGLEAGDVVVVVHVHPGGRAFEVEFMTLGGETVAVETLEADRLRPAKPREILHVRNLPAA